MKYSLYASPIGTLYIYDAGGSLAAVSFESVLAADEGRGETPLIKETKRQLDEYFAGKRRSFELPLLEQGTDFQRRAWQVLREIPYGSVISYGEQARRAGSPKGARAVGQADRENPWVIVVPCHRVTEANGGLGGFSVGLHRKTFLLELEASVCLLDAARE